MARIYGSTPYDTPEIIDLRELINIENDEYHDTQRRFHVRERELTQKYQDWLLLERPVYPTPAQIEGIARVAQLVHNDTAYGDHHGYPRPDQDDPLPSGISYSSTSMRMNLYAKAPYKPLSVTRIWNIEDDEIDAIRDIIKSHSLRVLSQWKHDDGVAFVLASTKV